MTDFITTIANPGAPIFDDAELRDFADRVRQGHLRCQRLAEAGEPRTSLELVMIETAATGLAAAQNRYAAMLLHNRLCELERRLLEKGI